MEQQELTWPQAIQRVLAASPTPLHYRQITEEIIARSLRRSLGATPAATVSRDITVSIKNGRMGGPESPYVRVAPGTFTLRGPAARGDGVQQQSPTDVDDAEDTEPQYEIITSFGMFWRRIDVKWAHRARLLGVQEIGATPVDFCEQRGIYLLYDGREVIYVGRSTDRPLGLRLYEHTSDRLATRWDRFSWFGLLPVTEVGELKPLPGSYESAKLIPALEAVLVEALEPRQNRKRGDDLAAVEYFQHVDPEIETNRLRVALDERLRRP